MGGVEHTKVCSSRWYRRSLRLFSLLYRNNQTRLQSMYSGRSPQIQVFPSLVTPGAVEMTIIMFVSPLDIRLDEIIVPETRWHYRHLARLTSAGWSAETSLCGSCSDFV